jgi:Carboxypeptidase regulatory-like domain
MRNKTFLRGFQLSVLVSLWLLLSSPIFGQDYRSRIQGSVTDPSDAAIVGAQVTLLNTQTGVSVVQNTNVAGHYLFDLVEPGTYTITVESVGFSKFVQEQLSVSSRADVTVDARLQVGEVSETVTVTAEAATLQFNNAKLETTVSQQLTTSLPQLYRNVFLLAQLDPAVQSTSWGEDNPYDTWASNNLRIGGSGQFTNDLQVDGSPAGISVKTGYVPSPDMVQEVNVVQNAVDAEYGHSSGSAISVVMKAGTNEFHGSGFFQAQRAKWNALENRVFRTENQTRNNMFGGTFGGAIIKNKLFDFVGYEGWEKTEPAALYNTVPTDLERTGDFSATMTDDGDLRPIYDPWSTQTAADGTITRSPYPGNVIPASQLDPTAMRYTSALWKANGPGIDAFHTDNYVVSTPIKYPYKNFSNRTDYVVNDKLRVYGRISLTRTPVQVTGNPTGSPIYMSDRGANYNMGSWAGNSTYIVSPSTVLNIHGGFHSFRDQSHFATDFDPVWGWDGVFPGADFYKPVFEDPSVPNLIPRMTVNGSTHMGPGGGYWHETPHAWEISAKLSQQHGNHYLKMGTDVRSATTNSLLVDVLPGFGFDAQPTSATYNNPDLLLSGDSYATFLLGAITPAISGDDANNWDSGQTAFPIDVSPHVRSRFYGFYLNDDWKLTRNLTLSLGLRYEYESPFHDTQNRETRALDLNAQIPELQGTEMPAELGQFYQGTWNMTGAFQFASDQHPGSWDGGAGSVSPRIGIAYRLNDKTVVRAAYGRYVTPWTTNSSHDQLSGFSMYGYSNFTGAPNDIQGVPQMRLDNPFPASNPVAPSREKSLGIYTMLGNSLTYFDPNRRRSNSDRFNFSVQRELPGAMVLDVTYFYNHTGQVFETDYNINQVDPQIGYTYKEATLAVMDNPFFDKLPVEKFPGALRYEPQVDVTSMAKPYPQYGDIVVVDGLQGGAMKYQALQIKLQKNYSKGVTLLVGYSYHLEKGQRFYNDIADYNRQYSWQNANNYRQRLTMAGSWDVPLGKGRAFLSGAPRAVDAIVGGWKLSPILVWRSGNMLGFGGMLWDGTDPKMSNQTADQWFNTSGFARLPDFTPRSNPWNFPGLYGPGVFNMDIGLVKAFRLTEKLEMQLKMDAFNLLNNMSWGDPSTNVNSSNFGRSTNQADLTYGRRIQLGARLEF